MTAALETLLGRPRVVLTTAGMMAALGWLAWTTMPREEDPRLADRVGVLVAPFPGATPEMVERLVVDPLEEAVFQVDSLKRVRTTARAGVAVVVLDLHDDVSTTEEAWDEVEDALNQARREMPPEVQAFALQRDIMADQDAMVLAVTGTRDLLRLQEVARDLKQRLVRLPGVAQVRLTGEPGEQVTVRYNDLAARRLGLSPADILDQLAPAMRTVPGGTLAVDGRSAVVFTGSTFADLERLRSFPMRLSSGGSVPLAELAGVTLGPEEPARERMRFQGAPAVAVGVVPQADIDVVALGERVRETVARFDPAGLQIEEMSFQPDRVRARLADLAGSLLVGMAVVAGILVVLMGVRLGAVVSAVVPLVALTAVALYALGGGVLHQIAVAALVIALGMLVDNAIVVAEAIQKRIDGGQPRWHAAAASVRELAVPLATATGTTLAAFVPMLASKGNTGDFTRAIPTVIMLTLVVSYLYAVAVTPVLSAMTLRPRTRARGDDRWAAFAHRVGALAISHPRRVIGAGLVAVVGAGWGAGHVDQSFFPQSGRDQLVVEVLLPEGSHLRTTDATTHLLESYLLEHPDVAAVASFIGRSAPKFYYNLPTRPEASHFAHVMVRTHAARQVPYVQHDIRQFAQSQLPQAEVIPRVLEQGPPIDAPIEVRLRGDNLNALSQAASTVMRGLRAQKGTVHVRHNQGLGAPQLGIRVADGVAARRGAARAPIALALLSQTRGRTAGYLRYGDDPIPLVVQSGSGENTPTQALEAVDVPTAWGPQPLAHLARVEATWEPSVIHRRDGERVITVSAQLLPGTTFGSVMGGLKPWLAQQQWPDGVRLEWGGNAEGSGEANQAIVSAAPLGIVLLILFLLIEFNSFRRLLIVLSTVPLAAAGVVPGLLAADQPFGFMSLLGCIALVGIVVNNAIVLLDRVESSRREGHSIDVALQFAVSERTRPILLTTATTVAGLMPLAFSASPLWPPMASAMIAGLLASTGLTLAVVPALYRILFRDLPPTPATLEVRGA